MPKYSSEYIKKSHSFYCKLIIMMRIQVIVVIRNPFIDKIPNLKGLLMFFSQKNIKSRIISVSDAHYPIPSFLDENISYVDAGQKINLKIPSIIKIFLITLQSIIYRREVTIIGADKYGLIICYALRCLTRKPYSSFILEYPEIKSKKKLSFWDKLERTAIKKSKSIITHDRIHSELISNELTLKKPNFLFLPNVTLGFACKESSQYLQTVLNENKKTHIILHSGGFGPYFCSQEVANAGKQLPLGYILVFHTSHSVQDDIYFKNVKETISDNDSIKFSLNPVPTDLLDSLISSSRIGLAWYSVEVLGYRALNMGLAAGKIGNFLKCGIPVIAQTFPSLNYLSKYKCGIQIDSLEMLNKAILEIDKNYIEYSNNAIKCYNDIWKIEPYCEIIMENLVSL
jgi:hypothetical protein